MNKLIISSFCILLFVSPIVFALDAATITFVHAKTKSTLIEKCAQKFPGLSKAACSCLAAKAESNLDDAALANCPNNSDAGNCIKKVVEQAVRQISKNNMKDCISRNAS